MSNNIEYLSKTTIFIIAISLGVICANLYYAQPIVALIADEIGLKPQAAGLVVTLTQLGYGLGVFFIVPLGDIVESRRLVTMMVLFSALGVLGLAFASDVHTYFLAALITGIGASAVQALVPYATHMVPEAKRGQVVGTLMSGLMIGIMLARPVSSYITDLFSWHSIFIISAIFMLAIAVLFQFTIPPKVPGENTIKYGALIKSMIKLFREEEVLRRRAIYQAFLFAAFCLFWTASPLYLASPAFNFSQSQIALFALIGVGGAVSAPFAGRAADRGYIRLGTYISIAAIALSFIFEYTFHLPLSFGVASLMMSAILIDASVSANLVLGQRVIFSLPAHLRSRVNGLFVATIFMGGAAGSGIGAWAYESGGWTGACLAGFGMALLALIYTVTEKKNLYDFVLGRS